MKKKTNKTIAVFWLYSPDNLRRVLQDPYFSKSNQGDYSYPDCVGPILWPILWRESLRCLFLKRRHGSYRTHTFYEDSKTKRISSDPPILGSRMCQNTQFSFWEIVTLVLTSVSGETWSVSRKQWALTSLSRNNRLLRLPAGDTQEQRRCWILTRGWHFWYLFEEYLC